ncbi:glycosyl transferase family 1 [Winogradskyella sp. PC-19]|uniref:glycosyltransferase n=1 Tax=unclassified Winogradskyella TaxID=2615021 RepID=UPI000B3C2F78|nr:MULTISPECIES: glycosyltransferase [unclassified Winogradskyella]ARV08478.1 glycosyl transferase family 1 [Winogradskyella sp. PC-19]
MEKKKVLIVLYYWPPAGGPGVQRWLKFVKYLPKFDIEPIVYCPSNPSYPIVDNSLENEILDEVTIIKQPIKEPYRFANLLSKRSSKSISSGVIPNKSKQSFIERLLLFVRGNFFIPDARKNWVKPSVRFLSDYINQNEIDTVITTGPPHSLHLIGLQLKQNLSIKWIADFRDPWTTIGYHKALKLLGFAKKKHIELEQQVLNSVDQIIVTSHHTKIEFSNKTNKPIKVITNGYDNHSVAIDSKDKKFTISHIGSLLSDRNPLNLWESISELLTENDMFAKAVQINFVGVVSDAIINSVKAYGLGEYLNIAGYVNHDKAIEFQKKSQLLLLIEINSQDTKAIIPGKLFEYMISETPIIAVGPEGSDIQNIIAETNTGSYFLYSEKEKLKAQILAYFETYQSDVLKTDAIGLQKYSRSALTKTFSDVLHQL